MNPRQISILALVTVSLFALSTVNQVSAQSTIEWSGMTWDIKTGNALGPGPNNWSDSSDSVWVDASGKLHLQVREQAGLWYSAEIIAQESLGYGKYEFRIESDTESFDQNVVAGFFTYLSDTEEIDIELSRFGDPNRGNAHYTVQPYTTAGNSHEFNLEPGNILSTHSFDWDSDRIELESLRGHDTSSPAADDILEQWTYSGSDIPMASLEKVRINFWLFQGQAPSNGLDHELVIDSFSFTPTSVPEPSSSMLVLWGILLAIMVIYLARRVPRPL
jgi:hypothetical protein